MKNKEILLEVKNLKQHFRISRKKVVKAVDDISFHIFKGETFGLVGESGSGKSTTGRTIIKLYKPTSGEVWLKGNRIDGPLQKELLFETNKDIQMIFQDPMACLNPRMKVEDIVAEGLDINKMCASKQERRQKVIDMLLKVGLNEQHVERYPHEFSGGQRQRIGIARALAVEPALIIADEPISALDVSIQAQVVNLMNELKENNDLTYLFIAHDLSMVKYISDRIAVMHKGKIVELTTSDKLFNNPLHPYTKSLISAIPLPDPELEKNRKRLIYDPSVHPYDKEEPKWVEIEKEHFILASETEVEKYKKEINAEGRSNFMEEIIGVRI